MKPGIAARLIVCLAAVVPYSSTIGNYFVGDDCGFIKELAGKPASHFLTLFTQSWAPAVFASSLDELRPFPAITYQLGSFKDPSRAALHHVISILIHAVNALLVLTTAECVAGVVE